jgi:uncharacterized protein (TIGR02271 family)
MANEIRSGMIVHSKDGERLGKVVQVERESLTIEKGFFFPTDYICARANVQSVNGEDIVIRLTKAELETGAGMSGAGTSTGAGSFGSEERVGATDRLSQPRQESRSKGQQEDVRIPLAQEELEVQKRQRKAGAVRVTKNVVTEQKQVTVPVVREEVRVERVPASAASTADGRFENQSTTVPVMEEEVVVSRRPVVREEVRISKEAHLEQRQVNESVRRETAEVEEDTDDDGTYRAVKDDGTPSHL